MRSLTVFGLALLAVALNGCGSAPPAAAPVTPRAVLVSPTPGGVTPTDTAWTQLMVALDERALTMLDLVPGRASMPGLTDLAATASAQLRTELGELRRLLARTGAPAANPHEGHDMPGMTSLETLGRLEKLTGPEFDQLVLAGLRAHDEQCLLLAGSEQTAGFDAATRELARTVERRRLAQLDDLAGLPRSG